MSRIALRLVSGDTNDGPLPSVQPGDLVQTGENRYPQYRVIATSGERAWVRDTQYGTDHVVPTAKLQPALDHSPACLWRSNGGGQ